MRRLHSILLAVLALAVVPQAIASAPATPVVVMFGDSIAVEAQPDIAQALSRPGPVQLIDRTAAASSPCDWSVGMRQVPLPAKPSVVLAETIGANLSECELDARGQRLAKDSKEFVAMFTRTLAAFIDRFPATTPIVLASAPPTRAEVTGGTSHHKRLMVSILRKAAAAHHNVTFVDAGASLESPPGSFTRTLPCRTGFPCTNLPTKGRNVVRALDGVHLCPSLGLPGIYVSKRNCPDPMIGAMIYAAAITAPVNRALGR